MTSHNRGHSTTALGCFLILGRATQQTTLISKGKQGHVQTKLQLSCVFHTFGVDENTNAGFNVAIASCRGHQWRLALHWAEGSADETGAGDVVRAAEVMRVTGESRSEGERRQTAVQTAFNILDFSCFPC